MKISESEFDWLAGLSGLSFDDSEKAEFMQDFEGIVAFADEIRELAAEEANLMEEKPQQNFSELREDVVKESLPVEEILSDRNDKDGYFSVKQVKLT